MPAPHPAQHFAGEHHLIVPADIARSGRRHPLLSRLLPTRAGYFPRARGHYTRRPQGTAELIIILCWSGKGWFEVNGRTQAITAGETVFIPAGTAHAYGAEDDDPWSILWAHATGKDLDAFMRALQVSRRALKLRLSATGLGRLDFHRVYQILEDGYNLPNLIASSSALRLVLAEMLRSRLAPGTVRREADPVQRAVEWMRQNLGQHLTLEELAHQVGLSSSHLSHLFRMKLGYSPMDYFARLRIQRACVEFDSASCSVKAVAGALGYADPYYFSRLFRRVMGISPKGYRAMPKG